MRHAGVLRFPWGRLRMMLDLPKNVVLDGVAYDPMTQTIGLIIEGHTTLPQVPDGAVVPWVEAEYDEDNAARLFMGFKAP